MEMVEKGYESNNSGAGIAWQELTDGDVAVVKWEKGLGLEEVKEMVRDAPIPFVVHFRIPSCGGSGKQLCHPFPIEENVPLDLHGATQGSVLFHNGHWNTWKQSLYNICDNRDRKLPEGKWTDTRAMAWTAYHYGTPVLDLIDEKTVVISPSGIEIFGVGWTRVNDVWCSNTHWQHTHVREAGYHYGGHFTMCRQQQCTKARYSNTDYCYDHQSLGSASSRSGDQEVPPPPTTFRDGEDRLRQGSTDQKTVQEGAKGVRAAAQEKEAVTKLLGPAPLVVPDDSDESWASVRRWVRGLQTGSDGADRQKRRSDRDKGLVRVGPL